VYFGTYRHQEDRMRTTAWIIALAAGLAAAPAADLAAQGNSAAARGGQQAQQSARQQQSQGQQERDTQAERQRQREQEWERQQRERDREREWERQRDRDRGRDTYGRQQQRGGSPAFCRSGAGHPVHGRQWCREKGFGLGSERWDTRRMGDIILRQPRGGRYEQRLDRRGLIDVLGDVVYGRFDAVGRQHGQGQVWGTWLDAGQGYGRSLQLSIGPVPFAELIDTNRDGRVDRVMVRR
jgi:hypothetical protein